MAFYPEQIPQMTKDLQQWDCYKLEVVDGDTTKVPYNPTTGQRASSTDPLSWVPFTVAEAAYRDLELYDGICFFVTKESGLVFIDLDDSIKDGHIEPWAMDIVKQFDSYSEISQSGEGLHLLIDGTKPGAKCRTAAYPHKIEIYDHARQACITGDVLEGHSSIEARQVALDKLYHEIFGEEQPQQATAAPGRSNLSDEDVLLKARTAKNGADFEALWKGSLLGYNGDESAADQAMMNKLAFYCGGDRVQMERLFSQSQLGQRQKWTDRQDYRGRTISKALAGRTEFYGPKRETATDVITEAELEAYRMPSGPKFSCNLPADHFITRYIGYGKEISDAYPDYWLAGAIHELAVVSDKKIKFVIKQDIIYTNLYMYIAGDSTLARKTTALKKSDNMILMVKGQHYLNTKVPNEFSPEAFIEHMDEFNHSSWVRDEAAGVLSLMKKDYMRGFKDTLMQLYDCTPITRMLRTSQRKADKTNFNVADPFLNVFFCSTDAALGANTELNDTLSGFLARFLFFFPQGEKDSYMPLEKGAAAHSALEEIVRAQLSEIAAKMDSITECVDMDYTPEARAYYNEWQNRREHELARLKDGFSSQIFGRLMPTVVKLAMLFELGSPDFDVKRPIRLEYFVEACRLVDEYFLPTARAVYDLVGSNAEKAVIDRIMAFLKRNGGKATRRAISRDAKIKSKELDEYLSTMIDNGSAFQREVLNEETGRKATYIFLGDVSMVPNVPNVSNVPNVTKQDFTRETKGTLAQLETKETHETIKVDVVEGESESSSPTIGPNPRKEDPGFQSWKAGMKKRQCCLCGRSFPYDLTPYVGSGKRGYICATCHMHGPPSEPAKADPQTKLEQAEAT